MMNMLNNNKKQNYMKILVFSYCRHGQNNVEEMLDFH